MAEAFPIQEEITHYRIDTDVLSDSIVHISEHFNEGKKHSPFENTGLMIKGKYVTFKSTPNYEGNHTTLGDVLESGKVATEFYLNQDDIEKWTYQKGAKKILRKSTTGHEYHFSEGGMVFPDALDKASRTIITGEGGPSPSRFKHVVQKTAKGRPRRLTPVELERLNMFPDDHTKMDDITDTKRAFFMGNALVVGVIEKIGLALSNKINNA